MNQKYKLGVTDIRWGDLTVVAGHSDPDRVPLAIEKLFSTDPEERREGYWGLDNHAVVQGDLYDSAPYVACVLVSRVLAGAVLTAELLDLLYELAAGSGEEVLGVGPLAGQSLESLCSEIVYELRPLFSELAPTGDALVDNTLHSLKELWGPV